MIHSFTNSHVGLTFSTMGLLGCVGALLHRSGIESRYSFLIVPVITSVMFVIMSICCRGRAKWFFKDFLPIVTGLIFAMVVIAPIFDYTVNSPILVAFLGIVAPGIVRWWNTDYMIRSLKHVSWFGGKGTREILNDVASELRRDVRSMKAQNYGELWIKLVILWRITTSLFPIALDCALRFFRKTQPVLDWLEKARQIFR